MKHIYRLTSTIGLLAVASMLFAGCGGGGSAPGRTKPTRADITYFNPNSTNANQADLHVAGRSNSLDEGVYTGFDPDVDEFHAFIVDELTGNNYREFYLYIPTIDPLDPEPGTTLDFADGDADLYYEEGATTVEREWTATSGRLRVLGRSGDSVTVQLQNVRFEADKAPATGRFSITGIFTYNQYDIEDESLKAKSSSVRKKSAEFRAAKKAAAPAKTKVPMKW